MRNLSIAQKIPLLVIITALISATIAGYISYIQAKATIYNGAKFTLAALIETKEKSLQEYLHSLRSEISVLSSSDSIVEAMRTFKEAWKSIPGDKERTLKQQYITDNPYPKNEKRELNSLNIDTLYNNVHVRFHQWFNNLTKIKEYENIYLVDNVGNVVYSVKKVNDFGANINSEKFKDTVLGKIFRNTMSAKSYIDVSFYPFTKFGDKTLATFAAPIFSWEEELLGVIIIQIPTNIINTIMYNNAGMGKTGETFLVGQDYKMISESRFSEYDNIIVPIINTHQVKEALLGKKGIYIGKNHRNDNVLSVYQQSYFMGTSSALIGEKSISEIEQPIKSMRQTLILFISAVIMLLTLIAFLAAVNITTPLKTSIDKINKLREGNTNFPVENLERKDEIGDISRAIEAFKLAKAEADRLALELKEQEERQKEIDHLRMIELNLAKEEAIKLGNAKSEFLANMSHELRTPMHAILSFSTFCLEDLDNFRDSKANDHEVYEEIKTNLSGIKNSGQRLLSLLNDLLDLSKLEAGKMELNISERNLQDVINNIKMEINSLLTKKNLELNVIYKTEDLLLKADFDKLSQVMINLLSNSIKFSSEGQKIFIEVDDFDPIEKDGQKIPAISFAVIDQGIGIPESEVDKVFDKFIQSSKTKSGAGGTGLGLAICREIIGLHGGKIWAENIEKEGGAKFTFVIPRQQIDNLLDDNS